jgi:hypothetical protein
MSIRFVGQENRSSGCGPACVAMIAGTTYERALAVMFLDGRKTKPRSRYADLKHALAALNASTDPRAVRCASFGSADALSIFACKWEDGTGNWHWVVYDPTSRCLYDPNRDGPIPLTDAIDRRYRPYSRLAVRPRRGSIPALKMRTS